MLRYTKAIHSGGTTINIISWNVAGLRACLNKGFIDSVTALNPDVIALQETKMMQGQAVVDLPGYHEFWNSAERKGYSGTAVFTKVSPRDVTYGMGLPEHDSEGRIICLRFRDFFLVNVYVPNSQRGLLRLDYRMKWEDDFRAYVGKLREELPVVICGDMNVAHQEIDIKNAKSNRMNAGFTDDERNKMTELLGSGFIDTYRHFHPDARDAYTWWSYMPGVREKNVGWRIDYFLASDSMAGRIADPQIYSRVMGSDHCPVGLTVDYGDTGNGRF